MHSGAGLRGELIDPQSPNYNAARKVYNGMIDRRPRLIARCADAADVIAAVGFAREHNCCWPSAARPHAGGLGVCDDGLVIDLSLIKYVRVDPKKKTIVAGGGCLWGTSIMPGTRSAWPSPRASSRRQASAA